MPPAYYYGNQGHLGQIIILRQYKWDADGTNNANKHVVASVGKTGPRKSNFTDSA
jgi:hypothetical protein